MFSSVPCVGFTIFIKLTGPSQWALQKLDGLYDFKIVKPASHLVAPTLLSNCNLYAR
jgi:hypothetical protein